MHQLKEMLTYPRRSNSPGELAFIARFLDPVPGMGQDGYGNRYLQIGDQPRTLFSAHTDTVHQRDDRQQVLDNSKTRRFYKRDGQPLGADNATGCWILLRLIAHRVPGLYIFHREEEEYGMGSFWIADTCPERLAGLARAVAFDRGGTRDVITHQSGDRCCSDTFAKALAKQIGLGFRPCARGVFTDTANYTSRIPECTNLSIGYGRCHTPREYQDYGFLAKLLPALLAVNWEALPVARVCVPLAWEVAGQSWAGAGAVAVACPDS